MSENAVQAPSDLDGATGNVRPVSLGYRRYAIGLLFLVYTFNFLDRQIVTILAEPIKRDLQIADWQLGLMTGTAFAIFYCTLGIPIARMAERRNRPWIIGLSLAAWSGFTALCGLAQTFWQLVLARIGVGVGEAGCSPPAHSLIADYTPKEQRASAMALYLMGNPIGALLGVVIGGLVADAFGWRTAFLFVGLPGVLLAFVVVLTLVEPRARKAAAVAREAAQQAPQTSFADVLRVLRRKRTFWLMAMAVSIVAFIGYGHAPFGASFFLQYTFRGFYGSGFKSYPTVEMIQGTVQIGTFIIPIPQIVVFVSALILMLGLYWLVERSKMGKASAERASPMTVPPSTLAG